MTTTFVPVVDKDQKPLMPTTPSRARRWVKSGKATPFWKKGVWCVRLNVAPSDHKTQDVVVGIDPGSKKEGLVVASARHCYLNVQADAVTWVQKTVESRATMRRTRRGHKCPHRAPRPNRRRNEVFLPPSTRARWGWKLRLVQWLWRLFPITRIAVEDVQATTKKGARRWNVSFSPLEVGKQWFYRELGNLALVYTYAGHEVARMRALLGLRKSGAKLAERWDAHCVDAWVLTRLGLGLNCSAAADNTGLLLVVPLRFHRRQLHRLNIAKGGYLKPYGGMQSLGFVRGSVVAHPRYGLCYLGGNSEGRLSLHSLGTGMRVTQRARAQDIRFRAYSSWRWSHAPLTRPVRSASHSSPG